MSSWKSAWLKSPGPRTGPESFWLFLKGAAMGTADIIPGVSGGTVAFITGIYYALLEALTSFNLNALRAVISGKLKEALEAVHLRFLLVLGLGILTALVSTARLMHYLLEHHAVLTWSLFFGLITASVIFLGREIRDWQRGAVWLTAGILLGWSLTGMIPVRTPEESWFIFLCGMIAICAMILPGISGSFILLILGKYAFITEALRNPFAEGSGLVLIIFAAGCAVGLIGFSRLLRYALARHHELTMALLTGLMIGALRKVWPWKIVLETELIRGKEYVLREENMLPEIDSMLLLSLGVMLLGFVLVFALERVALARQRDK
jgi:putative membrane protein